MGTVGGAIPPYFRKRAARGNAQPDRKSSALYRPSDSKGLLRGRRLRFYLPIVLTFVVGALFVTERIPYSVRTGMTEPVLVISLDTKQISIFQ